MSRVLLTLLGRKSPLIIGSDVRSLSKESLAILNNKRLISINQDELMVQATLRAASMTNDEMRPYVVTSTADKRTTITSQLSSGFGSPFVGTCSYGIALEEQKWQVVADSGSGSRVMSASGGKCLTIYSSTGPVTVEACDTSNMAQTLNVGHISSTVSQIKSSTNKSSCLAYDGSTLHMEPCRSEIGDAPNATDCWKNNCRFSVLSDQLFYLNGIGQLSLAFTNFIPRPNPGVIPVRPDVAVNVPMCLMTHGGSQPRPTPVPPPLPVNGSAPLQIWSGPLSGGDIVVLMLNAGDNSTKITASWPLVGLKKGVKVTMIDLWTGKSTTAIDSVSAVVGSHDAAVFRLSPLSVQASEAPTKIP